MQCEQMLLGIWELSPVEQLNRACLGTFSGTNIELAGSQSSKNEEEVNPLFLRLHTEQLPCRKVRKEKTERRSLLPRSRRFFSFMTDSLGLDMVVVNCGQVVALSETKQGPKRRERRKGGKHVTALDG